MYGPSHYRVTYLKNCFIAVKIYELNSLLKMKYTPATTVASTTTKAATFHFFCTILCMAIKS